jgi:hypothetical protein
MGWALDGMPFGPARNTAFGSAANFFRQPSLQK